MMRRKGFGVPDCDGGIEDANEQELERLVREDGQLFDNDHADRDGDKTQDLSAVFDSNEDIAGQKLSPVPASTLPTATVSEESDIHEDEEVADEEEKTPQEDKGQQPPPQKNTIPHKGRGGGIYVAVIAICLLLSLALLVMNSRETENLPVVHTESDTKTDTNSYADTVSSSAIAAEDIYFKQKSSSVTVCVYFKEGTEYLSGTVVWDDGSVVTVCGGIPQAERVEVVSADGKIYTAEVLGFDGVADIALLRCEGEGLEPIEQEDITHLQAGTRLYAIGTAEDARFGGSLFEGVVSFEERCVEIFGSDGNTRRAITVGVGGLSCDTLRGCPVYDEYGRAVAMLWGGTDGAVGLVVPMTRVLAVADFFRHGEVPDKSTLACIAYGAPSLGVVGENYAEGETVGVLIKDFSSPVCDSALKLRKNDIIISINGIPTKDTQAVKQTVYGFRMGDVVEIHVMRDSQILSFFVELE